MVFAVALLMGKGEQDLSTENRKMKKWEQTGLLIFRGKKSKISRDFQGQIRRKIGRFRGILAEKSQISKDFQGQILRKIGRFHGKFRGETSPRNNQ